METAKQPAPSLIGCTIQPICGRGQTASRAPPRGCRNTELCGPPADGQLTPTRKQDIHHLIADSANDQLASTRQERHQILITQLMMEADDMTIGDGDIVAFVADRLVFTHEK